MNAILASNPSALPSAVVDRAAMQKAIETVLHTVERRNTYPILCNVRLTGDGNTLFITGTDTDMEIVAAVPAAADAGLDMTLPAHLLKDLLKGAPKDDMVAIGQPEVVTKERHGGTHIDPETNERVPTMVPYLAYDDFAHIEFDAVDYQVEPTHPESWPEMKALSHNEARRFTLPGATFLAALDAVAFAISSEETRYYLNGAYLHHTPANGVERYNGHHGFLDLVTTDGHRLSRQTIDAPEGCEGMPGVILPKKLVYTLQKLWKGKNTPEQVSVEVTEEKVRVQFGDTTITSKVIEGSFPDYHRVTPQHNDKPMTVAIAALQEAIKAVSVIASERGGKAVKFEIEAGNLTLSVLNPNQGRAVTTIDAEVGFDDGLEIGFNAKYLNDFLANVKGESETVTFTFNDSGSPTLVTCDREGWLGVQMPMRV